MKKEISLLILDDTPALQEAITQRLQRAGFSFRMNRFLTKEAFIRELECRRPDAILSQDGLASFGPLSALGAAKEKRPDVPVIFVTLSAMNGPAHRSASESHAPDSAPHAGDELVGVPLSKLAGVLRTALRGADKQMRLKEMEFRVLTERWTKSKAIFTLLLATLLTVRGAQPRGQEPTVDKSIYHLFNPTPEKYLRELTTDGPGATESPYTVDAGHFQVEMNFLSYATFHENFNPLSQSARQEIERLRELAGLGPGGPASGTYRFEEWSVAPLNLKVGLLNQLDLQLILEPLNIVYERESYEYSDVQEDINGELVNVQVKRQFAVRRRGYGDTTLRLKWNLWGNDGGRTAMALTPWVKFPTSTDRNIEQAAKTNGLTGGFNNSLEGGVVLPFEVTLPSDFYVGLSPRFAFMRNVRLREDASGVPLGIENGYHAEFGNSIALSHDFSDYFSAYVEFFSSVSTERNSEWIGNVGPGLTFWITDDLHLFAGMKYGLTRSSDNWSSWLGMAWRF
jgi:CheY-like chemotaxis protein